MAAISELTTDAFCLLRHNKVIFIVLLGCVFPVKQTGVLVNTEKKHPFQVSVGQRLRFGNAEFTAGLTSERISRLHGIQVSLLFVVLLPLQGNMRSTRLGSIMKSSSAVILADQLISVPAHIG